MIERDAFFEGADFKNKDFQALIPKYYPTKYKQYTKEEIKLLKSKLKGLNRVLEAGVGIGRLIPELAPMVKEFVGIDRAELMLREARKVAEKFSNVRIVKGDLEKLSQMFPSKYFEFSLCLWNTLGNVDDEIKILKELSKVTSTSIFITVFKKGTLKNRIDWYKKVGIRIVKIDKKNEIFYSDSGLKSKAYSLDDIEQLAKKSDFTIEESKILAGVVLWVELKVKPPVRSASSSVA